MCLVIFVKLYNILFVVDRVGDPIYLNVFRIEDNGKSFILLQMYFIQLKKRTLTHSTSKSKIRFVKLKCKCIILTIVFFSVRNA